MRMKIPTVGEWTEAVARDLEPTGASMAHELKNPLAAMKALVQLGLRNPAESPSHDRLAALERAVTRMQEILLRHLSAARPPAPASERVQLGPLVDDALLGLSAQADAARVHLRSRGDACVEADPRRLEEALANLVANAIEATPAGGEVLVEVRPGADRIEVRVRDTGRGMTRATLRRVGTPFFTTRDGGSGLGVALARAVVAQHGGSLRYESEPGRGTTAVLTLPGPRRPSASAATAAGDPGRERDREAYAPRSAPSTRQ